MVCGYTISRSKILSSPLGVDIHLDTPTEVLHTILLGVVKYFWQQTVFILERDKTFGQFETRLHSMGTEGLNVPKIPADHICRHNGSLIGKHYKTLAQVMVFLVHDLVPKDVLDAWHLIGDLVVLLWHTDIKDTEEYLVSPQSRCYLIAKLGFKTSGSAREGYSRFSKRHSQMLSQYSHHQAQIPFHRTSSCLYQTLWSRHTLFHRTVRIV